MIRAFAACALCASLAVPVLAAGDQAYPLNGGTTKLTFVGKKQAGKHDGGFAKLTGTASVTDGKLDTLKIQVTIDTNSLYSDVPKLTDHLKSPDFFDVKNYPTATFKTTKVEKAGKLYTITGELTMLGKTKPVSFPASVSVAGAVLSLSTEFPIDRTAWGMNFGKGMIEDKVTLRIAVTAKK